MQVKYNVRKIECGQSVMQVNVMCVKLLADNPVCAKLIVRNRTVGNLYILKSRRGKAMKCHKEQPQKLPVPGSLNFGPNFVPNGQL